MNYMDFDLNSLTPYTLVWHIPYEITKVIFNNPATIVFWKDGTKTIVKCHHGDTYDKKTGLLLCMAKKMFGNGGKYNDEIRKWTEEEW